MRRDEHAVEKIVVQFDHTVPGRKIPDLAVPSMPRTLLKEFIRAHVAPHVDGPVRIHLEDTGGLIDVGVEQGRFTLLRRPRYSG